MAKPTGKPSRSIPLRLNAQQKERVQHAAALLGLSKQDIMRLAMGIGIEALRRVDWNIERVVADAAFPDEKTARIVPMPPPQKRAAQDPGPTYGPPGDE
ncbi:MAG TPA: hypothetical protein VGM54_10180 [Chthoniobacter sp.]|jgi:hypothetical protein